MDVETKIFFDESGKSNDYPILMGALRLPSQIYDSAEFTNLKNVRTHWTEFKQRSVMRNLINLIAKFSEWTDLNVINYDENTIKNKITSKFRSDPTKVKNISKKAIYAKFPERIFYGLLRNNPQHIHLKAKITMESATVYAPFLSQICDDLNVQAIYRGENFTVTDLNMVGKGTEVGLEITDLLLGIMRCIIRNEDRTKSKRLERKTKFIAEILHNDLVRHLLTEKNHFYEWHDSKALQEVDFKKYLHSFTAKNYDLLVSGS